MSLFVNCFIQGYKKPRGSPVTPVMLNWVSVNHGEEQHVSVKDVHIPSIDSFWGLIQTHYLFCVKQYISNVPQKPLHMYISILFSISYNLSTKDSMALHEWTESARLYEVNEDKLGYFIELLINVVYFISQTKYCDSSYSQLYPTQFWFCCLFTSRIRSMREGNVFSLFVCPPEGVSPVQVLSGR